MCKKKMTESKSAVRNRLRFPARQQNASNSFRFLGTHVEQHAVEDAVKIVYSL